VYDQKSGQLDLWGDVALYREDGTVLQTDTATIDTKHAVAVSNDRVHVEGPFGTLDAQGFSVLDNGAVMHFNGPGRMLLNGAGK
jgi:lipopolysaccharide export system protein LptC